MPLEGSAPGTPARYRRPIFWLCLAGVGLGVLSTLF